MHLLDTSALVKFAREIETGRSGPVSRFLSGRRKIFVSVVCIEEFLEGADDALLARRFLAGTGFRAIVIGHGLAVRTAALQRTLMEEGRRLGENDAWIAATALASSLEVVGDDKAFERVPRLKYRRV